MHASVVETFRNLSMESDATNYAVTTINDRISGSKYILLTDLKSGSGTGKNIPQTIGFTRLDGGANGTPTVNDYIGNSSASTGFSAFDAASVQLLTCERTDPAILSAALGYCANRGDCMYVGAVPLGIRGSSAGLWPTERVSREKVYGALYGPWIQISDPLGTGANPAKFVPPSGHVMGVYARIATTRGIWKAPAGDEAKHRGSAGCRAAIKRRG